VLKSFLKTDYRGIVAHLTDCPSLVETLRLKEVPHYTTLQKAAGRLLASAPAKRLLDATVREHLGRRRRGTRTAIDSTGLESTAASGYFVHRRRYIGDPWKAVIYHRFPKIGIVCDVQTHFILSAEVGRGPKPASLTSSRSSLQLSPGSNSNALPLTPGLIPMTTIPSRVRRVAYARSFPPSTAGRPQNRPVASTAGSCNRVSTLPLIGIEFKSRR
jgi:hypothetical protein